MSIQTFPKIEQGTDEWFAVRRGVVTASVVGQLLSRRKLSAIDFECPDCGALPNSQCLSKRAATPMKSLHPDRAEVARNSPSATIIEAASNDTSRDVTMRLVAEMITGHTEDTFMTDAMWRGVEDEPRARDLYSETFAPAVEIGFMTREADGCVIGYSPDGLVGDDGLIEVKSRNQKSQLATILAGHPPIENMAQLQAGLWVSDRRWIDYISYCGGMPMWVQRIYPDPKWIEPIKAAARMFAINAPEMIRNYDEEVQGLPMTERVDDDFEIQIGA